MYLSIYNPSVIPVECFTIFGASTSRGKDDKIGQFGTGSKQGILALIRFGLSPIIISGDNRITFTTKQIDLNGGRFNQVVSIINGVETPRDYVLEHGALDWDSEGMALREFISNAIDADGFDKCKFELFPTPATQRTGTTIFVPTNPSILKYWYSIHDHFLHFSGKEKLLTLAKKKPSPPLVYRKGVFVRQHNNGHNSLFDYNFQELSIDECRNSNDSSLQAAIGKVILSDTACIAAVFESIRKGIDAYELSIPAWLLYPNLRKLQHTWTDVCGSALIARTDIEVDMAARKGLKAYKTPEGWYAELSNAGIPTVKSTLLEHESNGYVTVQVTEKAKSILDKIWEKLLLESLTNGKSKPKIGMFSKTVNGEGMTMGYYSKGTIYINVDFEDNVQTYLEEICHHITGSSDFTRDFQEFAFQVATRFMKI